MLQTIDIENVRAWRGREAAVPTLGGIAAATKDRPVSEDVLMLQMLTLAASGGLGEPEDDEQDIGDRWDGLSRS